MAMIPAGSHRALAAYLRKMQVASVPDRLDGAVMLVFREGFRVGFHPAGPGDLVMEARILTAPGARPDRIEALCKTALERAGQRAWDALDALAVSADGTALLLQQWVPADCSVAALERQIDAYLGAVAWWRVALTAEMP